MGRGKRIFPFLIIRNGWFSLEEGTRTDRSFTLDWVKF